MSRSVLYCALAVVAMSTSIPVIILNTMLRCNFLYLILLWKKFSLIPITETSLQQSLELILDQLLAQRTDAVDKHLSVKMVELMLHDSGKVALNPLVMLLQFAIEPLNSNACRTRHLLVYSRQREAPLFHCICFCIVVFHDMWIDKRATEVLVLRHIVCQYIKIYHHQSDSLTNLWCR